jgi:hypothetical protein
MAVDKGYGSGKSRSAANSSMRRRVAAGQTPKSKKGIGAQIKANNAKLAASPLGQIAETLLGFALPVGKLKAASLAYGKGLGGVKDIKTAISLDRRITAKEFGKYNSSLIAASGKRSSVSSDKNISDVFSISRQNRRESVDTYPRMSKPKGFEAMTYKERGARPSKGWATEALNDMKKSGAGWQGRAVKRAISKQAK